MVNLSRDRRSLLQRNNLDTWTAGLALSTMRRFRQPFISFLGGEFQEIGWHRQPSGILNSMERAAATQVNNFSAGGGDKPRNVAVDS